MASTNGCRSRGYSSACACSTGSSQPADPAPCGACLSAEEPVMSDRFAELDAALERVIASARAHLAAVKAAEGAPDDDAVWHAYVGLNNASRDYDDLLNEVFGEVTPWDLEEITGEDPDGSGPATLMSVAAGALGHDPH